MARKIGFKLIVLLVVTLTFFLIAFGYYDYNQVRDNLISQTEKQSEMAIQRLSKSLPGLVWNFETDQVDQVLLSEVKAGFVYGIIIRDAKGEVTKGLINEDFEGIKKTVPYKNHKWDGPTLKEKLEFDDYGTKKKIGSVSIWIDESEMNAQLADVVEQTIFKTLVLDIILAVVISLAARTLVDRPLTQVINALHDIAEGEGDLTRRLDSKRNDQIGDLANEFNTFVEKIFTLVIETRNSMREMEGWVNKVAASAVDIKGDLHEQHEEIDQVTAATHELGIASQNVAENAQQAAESVHSADAAAAQANTIVMQGIEAIKELAEEIDSGAQAVDLLQNDVANITSVLAVIRGIAEQTNLLALNAAIEAARAGEMGRGFAVVADEVRALASRTQEATEEIQSMIEKLQGGAQKAVEAMRSSKGRSEDSVEMSSKTGDALSDISNAMSVINDMSIQIASATEEQNAVCDDVTRNLTKITSIAGNITEVSQTSVETASSLQDLNKQVLQSFDRFKVD
ncbi:methyl-accepting chemotaxis protein [Litoribacillus peritrichatus]|uniref:Methyl-accepting chemotaxis protein n=1 Tax=Litoribacillus peritrichatus TaxID=718191 RepID=A0ABP7MTQ7_9GAMM